MTPCKDCERRHAGCHASCEDYLAWRKAKDEKNAEMYKKARADADLRDFEFQAMKNFKSRGAQDKYRKRKKGER